MNVLVLGGTNFIGPHVVDALLAAGHAVTVFNRGKTGDGLPATVERLRGDRTASDLAALNGRVFDATVDMCGYFPRAVEAVFDAVEDAGHYCFISTLSVYAGYSEADQDEFAPLASLEDESVEEITDGAYGGLKVLCERVVASRASSYAVLRLGIVVGPGDGSDRFTYWIDRVSRGGRMLAPIGPTEPMQWIDARDVADFAVECIARRTVGTFNVVTPARAHTLGAVIAAAAIATGSLTSVVWLSAQELEEHELSAWTDFPAWMASDGPNAGFATFDARRAADAGLRYRPLKVTVNDLLEWWRRQDEERRHLRTGLSGEREDGVVDAVAKNKPIVSLDVVGREREISALISLAFGTMDESALVSNLRAGGDVLEVYATMGEKVVGHVAFSPLRVSPDGRVGWALAPMSVDPDWQGEGIGTLIGEAGIELCRAHGIDFLCVLGHPDYYPRFGFDALLGARVRSEYSGAGAAWMALELTPNSIDDVEEVIFHPAFGELGVE